MDFKNNYDRYWKRFTSSFVYAWTGVKQAFRHEQNLKIQLIIAVAVITLSIALTVPFLEKLILLLVIGIVISLEMINTALERLVDLVTKEYHPLAKVVKDVSAGAVMIFSVFAVVIGILIFYEPIMQLLR
ncbi:diacylglycerol kinase family protein [Bacillaceae bacterium IKA-2]|jgi:undecaprenol kinase|nr:diacylglycerol kinase family protein [Bacillaceae bacterium IKA-2]